MAVDEHGPITSFDDWYTSRSIDNRDGSLDFRGISAKASHLCNEFDVFRREHYLRVANYENLEKQADAKVVSTKPDLPNISSGETAGMVRRIARNVVQHTPNVEIINEFDDDDMKGIMALYILKSKVIGDGEYSNDMQQHLFASCMSSFTLGFTCVIPVLLQRPDQTWYIKYDTIHYQDVFPEPDVKDIRETNRVFIRRYLSRGEIVQLIRNQTPGWDIPALIRLIKTSPQAPAYRQESTPHQTASHHRVPRGYEIITFYNDFGDPFLTFEAHTRTLLRIEENRHPLKQHPVHFLVLEKDPLQPYGKSQVELIYGRQEFQDLMLNGAMKLWYRNINPSIIGYGTVNAIPNLSPGKYTNIANPNAKVEAFEVNTQTLLQYNQISQANLGSMVQLVGAADQQMAASSGNGMSATPQGVQAQQTMVDITTNNYQKAIESFFSHYCSYALTLYFNELKGVKKLQPSAEARLQLTDLGFPAEAFDDKGVVEINFAELATQYYVRCVPGSLVELEDEKQLRILNQLFVPLSQAMPALAATQQPEILQNAAAAMQYIIGKEIQLSGSTSAHEIKTIFETGRDSVSPIEMRYNALDSKVGDLYQSTVDSMESHGNMVLQLMQQMQQMQEVQTLLLQKLGVTNDASDQQEVTSPEPALQLGQ